MKQLLNNSKARNGHPKKQYAAILQISVEDVNTSQWKRK